MPIARYLAMTAAEFSACADLPPHVGWMACHFSPSGPGLSNMPRTLPLQSLLLVDDSNPFHEHQSEIILQQLQQLVNEFGIRAVILDFQRPNVMQVQELVSCLQQHLPCPVVATPEYAGNGPFFLPPCPLHQPLKEHLAPYKGREVWLEIALDGEIMHITDKGCHTEPFFYSKGVEFPHQDEQLHCHYKISQTSDALDFYLQRTQDDLCRLLEEAEHLGVAQAVGLWQELR